MPRRVDHLTHGERHLQQRAGASVSDPAREGPPRFYSVPEFCAVTGLSAATVRRRIRDGSLPKWQPGGANTRVLIPAGALDLLTPAIAQDEDRAHGRNDLAPARGPRPRWQHQYRNNLKTDPENDHAPENEI